MKLVIADRGSELYNWLFDANFQTVSFKAFLRNPDAYSKANLVYFHGGEDVSAQVYMEKEIPETYSNSRRDLIEMRVYTEAQKLKIPCLGICRGSQFLTAVQPGGRLVQHVTGHSLSYPHKITTHKGTTIEVTSTHHQMMYPFGVSEYELLAVSSPKLSNQYKFGLYFPDQEKVIEEKGEPEIVYYPKTNCLAIQGHPEYYNDFNTDFCVYSRELVKDKLLL